MKSKLPLEELEKLKVSTDQKEQIFVERFRPKTIDNIILPEYLKDDLRRWKKDGQIPNLLLISKTPGLGKSSLAHTIINELNAEALFINASLESNIDMLRDKIRGFVSTVSFNHKPKIVVLDEADGLNERTTQPALRAFIEEFSKSARFILTVNYQNKIIEPLQSRLMDIDFDLIFKENQYLVKDIYSVCIDILKEQGITYNAEDVKYLIKHYYPSTRNIIMKIQQFSFTGELILNKGSLDSEEITNKIMENIIEDKFEVMRKNISLLPDPGILFTALYDNLDKFPVEKRPPFLICIARYQANDGFVRDRVVNSAAMCSELMALVRI